MSEIFVEFDFEKKILELGLFGTIEVEIYDLRLNYKIYDLLSLYSSLQIITLRNRAWLMILLR